jgi:phosphoglycolate phosphatase-like HAD superfamily hydrolase
MHACPQTPASFTPASDFFIGIDSDGCAFDTMEVKHKACFYPMVVRHWHLAGVAKYARDAWDFVNLYSQSRGCNRFLALLRTLDLLGQWDEPVSRGYRAPDVTPLRQWVQRETKLGNPALEAEVLHTGDDLLRRTLAWSKDINAQVEQTVRDVPPFPSVRHALEAIAERADLMVVSATPNEALRREWDEHDIARCVQMICGQEMGKKAEHIAQGAGGKYPPEKMLMIGDAPGDLQAARANDACFYPINPGGEEDSWRRFLDESAGRFFEGTYKGDYEDALIAEFMARLPDTPPWQG